MSLPAPSYAIKLDVKFNGVLKDVVVTSESPGSPITRRTVFEWATLTEAQQRQFNAVVNTYGGTLPISAPVAGREAVRLSPLSGSPIGSNPTGYQSDGTRTFYAIIYVDNVKHSLQFAERSITTYTSLINALNSKLSGIATSTLTGNSITIASDTTGSASTVNITRSGDRNVFSSLADFRTWTESVHGIANTNQMLTKNHLTFLSLQKIPVREPLFDDQRSNLSLMASSDLPFLRFLDTVGDGTGDTDANQNFDIGGSPLNGETLFKLTPAAGTLYVINSLNIHYADNGLFNFDGFGAQGAAITNGISITGVLSGRTFDFTGGIVITENTDWQHVATNVLLNSWANPGDSLVAQMNIQSFGRPLLLNGDKGDELRVHLRDDFTFLTDFHFVAHGFT